MEFVQIGKILNTHGVKGELKIDVLTDFVEERFKPNSFVYLGEKHIKVSVKKYRFHQKFMLLTFNDLEDINLVNEYKSMVIYKSLDDIKPLDDGFYFRDLKGLDVYADNKLVGKVKYAESGLSSNYLRVITNDNKEVLVPILDAFVKDVDLNNKRININNIEGLLWK